MTIIHELTLDLQKKGDLRRIDVVQGDAGTRLVELTLLSGGEPWDIPTQALPAVRYLKPDGTSGIYDCLPDGTSCFTFSGNVLSLELSPRMLTCAGAVQVQVELSVQEQRIATFAFLTVVEQAVAMDAETGDYVNWTKVHLPQVTNAAQGQYLQIADVDEAGRVLELVPVDDPAAEVKVQIPVLESHISDAGQRAEDAGADAASALRLASSAVIKPDSAQVGQVLAVKTVDGNGKPTEWKTVDLPAGSSGGETGGSCILADFTVEEDVGGFTIPLCDDPFRYSSLLITVTAKLLPDGDKQYIGKIFGSEKQAWVCHLNTLFDSAEERTVEVMVNLFETKLYTAAHKKDAYQWLVSGQYSFVYDIEANVSEDKNVLVLEWASAVAGSRVTVEGVK